MESNRWEIPESLKMDHNTPLNELFGFCQKTESDVVISAKANGHKISFEK